MLLAVAVDQCTKWFMLEWVGIAQRDPIAVAPFFNLVMVWNTGVSFGMFAGALSPLFFIVLKAVVLAALAVWLWRVELRITAVALGLVMGGALGNMIDRIHFGAVADFLDFHAFGYHWPAFNIADACIFIGVVVLCLEAMLWPSTTPE